MLPGMNLPRETPNERRAVPRHLRDAENELMEQTGSFQARAGDVKGGRGRMVVYALLVLAAAGVAAWLGLKP
jgi:hypothetical protein